MSTKKTEKPIGKEEAAQILLSAVGYCQKAGLKIYVRSVHGKLAVYVEGLQLAGSAEKPTFVPTMPVTAVMAE